MLRAELLSQLSQAWDDEGRASEEYETALHPWQGTQVAHEKYERFKEARAKREALERCMAEANAQRDLREASIS